MGGSDGCVVFLVGLFRLILEPHPQDKANCLVHLSPAPRLTTFMPRRQAKNRQSLECAESALSSFPPNQVPKVSSPTVLEQHNGLPLETPLRRE